MTARRQKERELQARCPLCKELVRRPPARFSMLARCPTTGLQAPAARGPLFHARDGHAFAVERFDARRIPQTRWARFKSALRSFWITLRQG
jgi:hypothetical protein